MVWDALILLGLLSNSDVTKPVAKLNLVSSVGSVRSSALATGCWCALILKMALL
jgi:hypothetical protein